MSTEKTLSLVRMSDVRLQEVNWLWKPYIPFGKLTIIQGDPGEGKTTLALRLAAACSSGTALPGMEIAQPFNVIYQTAEDGLGDKELSTAEKLRLEKIRGRKISPICFACYLTQEEYEQGMSLIL